MENDRNKDEQWFSDEDLFFEQLLHIFNQNEFKSESIDESIYVYEGFSYPVYLKLDEHSGVIRCRAKAQLLENYFQPEFDEFLGHLNSDSNSSFFIEHDDENDVSYLVGGNFFIKSEGLTFRMIISNIVWFLSSFLAACRVDEEHEFIDRNELIEKTKQQSLPTRLS